MSDVNFDPENGSRTIQLARGVSFTQNGAFLKHLGVTDVDFDHENRFRVVKVVKSEI